MPLARFDCNGRNALAANQVGRQDQASSGGDDTFVDEVLLVVVREEETHVMLQ